MNSGLTRRVGVMTIVFGPAIAGWITTPKWNRRVLAIAATMKIAYDFLLWGAFRNVRPPEERIASH